MRVVDVGGSYQANLQKIRKLQYTEKRQGTKQWPILPHHIPPLPRTLSPNVLYYRRIAK